MLWDTPGTDVTQFTRALSPHPLQTDKVRNPTMTWQVLGERPDLAMAVTCQEAESKGHTGVHQLRGIPVSVAAGPSGLLQPIARVSDAAYKTVP